MKENICKKCYENPRSENPKLGFEPFCDKCADKKIKFKKSQKQELVIKYENHIGEFILTERYRNEHNFFSASRIFKNMVILHAEQLTDINGIRYKAIGPMFKELKELEERATIPYYRFVMKRRNNRIESTLISFVRCDENWHKSELIKKGM